MNFLQHFTDIRILPFRNISMILEGLLKNYEKTDRPKDKGALENNQMSVEGKGVRIVPLVSVSFLVFSISNVYSHGQWSYCLHYALNQAFLQIHFDSESTMNFALCPSENAAVIFNKYC